LLRVVNDDERILIIESRLAPAQEPGADVLASVVHREDVLVLAFAIVRAGYGCECCVGRPHG
jgi:hypothetical protein